MVKIIIGGRRLEKEIRPERYLVSFRSEIVWFDGLEREDSFTGTGGSQSGSEAGLPAQGRIQMPVS